MEFDEATQKLRRISSKTGTDLANVTILGTPRPQATSTVERRTYGSRDLVHNLTSEKYRRLYDSPPNSFSTSNNSTDESLGILENLPSFFSNESGTDKNQSNLCGPSDERELARKLLQRCSEFHLSNPISDGNKENNANSPNLSEDRTPSTLLDSGQSFNLTTAVQKDQNTLRTSGDKISTSSMQFEPSEITARSSAMSKSMENKDAQSSIESSSGISFGSAAAQLMAQFENEDFQSGSLMSNQFLADELSFQQNALYALPVATSTEKEHLSLSCFSGIIGDMDLTIDSCAGRKVSVGEFFKRKCGNIGHLTDVEDACQRPSFGMNIRSPTRIGQNIPLVDLTTMTEDSTSDEKSEKMVRSFTDNTREHTIMSLSTIAQALKDIDSGTPRRLVDQLLMAKKQKKKSEAVHAHNLTSDTYTLPLPNSRNSLPVCPSGESTKIDKEDIFHGRSAKFSLDSKSITQQSFALKCHETTRNSITNEGFGDTLNYNAENTMAEMLGEKLAIKDLSDSKISSPRLEKPDVRSFPAIKKEQSQTNVKIDASSKSREFQADLTKRRMTDLPHTITQSMIKKEDTSAQRSALEASIATNHSNEHVSINENVEIGKNTEELHHCIVGVRREVDIELVNKSHRWIICSLSLSQIQGDRNDVEFEVTPKSMLIPDSHKVIKIGVKVLKQSRPIRATINAEMSEMPTRSSWHMQHTMWFVPEEPKIVVTAQTEKDELEFETTVDRPSKTQSIIVENKNNIDVPLELFITNNDERKFQLEFPDDHTGSKEHHNNDFIRLVLGTSKQFKVIVRYNSMNNSDRKRNEACTSKLLLRIHDKEQNLLIKEISLVGFSTATKTTSHPTDRLSENFRCDTPQQRATLSSPTSPHSSASNRSGISGRNSPLSSASGGTVAGDVVSIRATHAALVWNSIKVGKTDLKEFTIRNTSNNKIKLQATIVDNDKSFKFLRERQHHVPNIVLSLQRMESRTFTVVFNPNNSGPTAGRIVFKHYEPQRQEGKESRPSKVIFLYGYGGVGKVEITEAFKDTGGKLWLSLGSLNAGGTLDAKIKLQNTGDLSSYAKIKLTPKAVYPAMVSSWHVEPTELLLGPQEVRWVTLEFRPRKEDLALLRRANVSHVGTLTITHGDEPTRLRIRRLYKKLSQNGQMSGKENEAFRNVVYPICKVFPGETPINNLSIIRDSVENLGDLCRGVLQQEVMLTMEVNAEETMSILHDNADDTQTFYSLCSDTSLVFPATDESFMPSETLMECTVDQRIYEDDFSVSPSTVTLKPPTVNEATIMIMSSSNVAQPFDTVISHSEFLNVLPAEGMIPTRRGFPIRIQCKKTISHSINAVLQVYTENEKRDVHIRVVI
ncbi:uncharacterized protein spd-2 isoform X2 [Venturia canescens]|uniref:uncharacterized protein spd-2 isoform X2 n=1 Tax=Venturia canescens TaxID=32260 RepID=UPI001C9C7765|nr:uncharacterized protein LOC122406185 isoform X2 [Venturia canescens]